MSLGVAALTRSHKFMLTCQHLGQSLHMLAQKHSQLAVMVQACAKTYSH